MKERAPVNVPAIVLSVLAIVVTGLFFSFIYLSVNGKDYSSVYSNRINSGEISNPLSVFSLVEEEEETNYPTITITTPEGEKKIVIKSDNINYTLQDIQRELVGYTSIIMKLYNLHNIPFTSITPKVLVYIDNEAYFMEVNDGNIEIDDGAIESPDIIIRTSSAAIIESLEGGISAGNTISSGAVQIEMIASKLVLFSKGYLNLYKEFL